jgi:hypothetical protein
MGSQARSHPIAEASNQVEFRRALISTTTLMLDLEGVQWCLGQVAGASHVDRLHWWRLTVRAGGAVAFAMMQASVYPWRGILLTSRGDGPVEAVAMGVSLQESDGIDEFIADVRTCPNMCFIDPVFRLIWKTFPSRQLLLSTGCVGITRAIQMVAPDIIGNVERQRAGESRNSGIQEQTYLELVCDASAAHTLQQLRVSLRDKTLTKAEALTKKSTRWPTVILSRR